jgi:DNA-binding NarL/FixJ family response regulator
MGCFVSPSARNPASKKQAVQNQAVIIEQTDRPVAIPVVVADPTPLYRAGLVEAIERAEGMFVRAAVEDLHSALAAVGAEEQALCVCARSLCGQGFEGVLPVAESHPRLRILVILGPEGAGGATPDSIDITSAMASGIVGLLEHAVSASDVRMGLATIAAGRTVWAPGVLSSPESRPQRSVRPTLTRRERQVLDLMSQGMGNRAIAAQLFISENTVKNHVRRVHEKLGVRTRTEAVVRAAHDGLVEISAVDR